MASKIPNHHTGRPNPLDDPAFAKSVATALINGASRAEMCEMFDRSDPDTITRWKRDPRVKAHAEKLIADRTIQIARRVDSQIEARLQNAEELTVRELIDIRKEYLPKDASPSGKQDEGTTDEAMKAIEENPEFIAELEELVARSTAKRPE